MIFLRITLLCEDSSQRWYYYGAMLDDKPGSKVGSDIRWKYEIRLRGSLNQHWAEWFNGSTVRIESSAKDPSITTIYCQALDQAKLRGILNKLWDLNLKLLSVRKICDPPADRNLSEGS